MSSTTTTETATAAGTATGTDAATETAAAPLSDSVSDSVSDSDSDSASDSVSDSDSVTDSASDSASDPAASTVWPHGAPAVGRRARRSRLVRFEDIQLFTAISGDRNPLHYDRELAAASRFGGIIVQGGVTTAILNAVVAEDLPGPGSVFLHVDWSFRAPVRPGDTITGSVEVLEARDDKPITRLRTTVTRDDGVVALEGTALCYTVALPDD